jgi:hypothetical protein
MSHVPLCFGRFTHNSQEEVPSTVQHIVSDEEGVFPAGMHTPSRREVQVPDYGLSFVPLTVSLGNSPVQITLIMTRTIGYKDTRIAMLRN